MKFRKKPVVIEALQYNGDCWKDIGEFLPLKRNEEDVESPFEMIMNDFYIVTLEGKMLVNKGDWVVKGICPKRGIHFWPVKPEYFAENYEKVIDWEPEPFDMEAEQDRLNSPG